VHAEITALVVASEQLEVTVDATADELVARRRDGGEEVRVPVSGGRAELPFASLTHDGVWDLWLDGERRVGKHPEQGAHRGAAAPRARAAVLHA
jgi:hypothetical protein